MDLRSGERSGRERGILTKRKYHAGTFLIDLLLKNNGLNLFQDIGDDVPLRAFVTSHVIRGEGLDIGPLHRPMQVPAGVQVTYVDRLPKAELIKHYPELAHLPIIEPDVIDDGEKLDTFGSASQDFIIASHFIEHTEDPIGTLKNFCRVVKSGGTILLIVPERKAYFDKDRPLTVLDHLIQDHEMGPHFSRRSHYVEYADLVDGAHGSGAYEHARALDERRSSIHFHVWTGETFLEQFSAITRRYSLPIELIAAFRPAMETIVVYRRL